VKRLIHDSIEAAQSKAIHDLLAPAFRLHETTVAQAGEVRADPRLWLRHLADQLTYRAFSLAKELENLKSGRIAQDPKEAGDNASGTWR